MYKPFINGITFRHFGKCVISAILCTSIAILATGCSKNNDDEISSEDTSSVVSAATQETVNTEPIDTPDTPDSPDTAVKKTPYDYPYEIDKIKEELIAYGESLELYYTDNLTMKKANSVVKIQTRLTENGRTLERWCRNDIDSIVTQALYRNIDLDFVNFNIMITESPTYKGQYTITILSQND